MIPSKTLPISPHWRPRHRTTWAVGAAITSALVLIVVPGVQRSPVISEFDPTPLLSVQEGNFWGGSFATAPPDPNTLPGPLTVHEFSHGWPLTYARRAVGYGGTDWPAAPAGGLLPRVIYPDGLYASWSVPGAWLWRSDRIEFSQWRLLADIAIAIVVVGVAMMTVESWIRRRKGLRFTLLDALVATTVVAAGFGWRQWHLVERRNEERIVADLYTIAAGSSAARPPVRCTHDSMRWLSLLIGTPEVPTWKNHIRELGVASANLAPDDWRPLGELRWLRTVRLWADPTGVQLKPLPQLRGVQELAIQPPTSPTADLSRQRIDLGALAEMPNLKQLFLTSHYCTIDDLEPLLRSKTLDSVTLAIFVTDGEIARFKAEHHPRFTLRRTRTIGSLSTVDPTIAWHGLALRIARWKADGAIGTPLKGRSQLESLDLSGIRMDAEKLASMTPIAPLVKWLSLGSVDVEDTQLSESLAYFSSLRGLDLGDRAATPEFLRSLKNLHRLRSVTFRQGEVTAADIQQLYDLSELEHVDIYRSSLTPAEVWQIEQTWASQKPSLDLRVFRGDDSRSPRTPPENPIPADPNESNPFEGGSELQSWDFHPM